MENSNIETRDLQKEGTHLLESAKLAQNFKYF